MTFIEIAHRLTGFSCPVFGVSWQAPEAERTIVRRVISFLEDRRVLYDPTQVEVPGHCVESVVRIREFLTAQLHAAPESGDLNNRLRLMRAACRKFLTTLGDDQGRDLVIYGAYPGHSASWTFISALGELRGAVGIQIAHLSVQYGIDVEDHLAVIFPVPDEPEAGEDASPSGQPPSPSYPQRDAPGEAQD